MRILGIDPGKSGGFAVLADGRAPRVHKMPETETDVFALLTSLCIDGNPFDHAFVERVHAIPSKGKFGVSTSAMFNFGMGYGGLRMALIALMVPFTTVPARTWQASLNCLTGGDKNISKARAQQLFPMVGVTHATADALLIAEYGRRTIRSTQPVGVPNGEVQEVESKITVEGVIKAHNETALKVAQTKTGRAPRR